MRLPEYNQAAPPSPPHTGCFTGSRDSGSGAGTAWGWSGGPGCLRRYFQSPPPSGVSSDRIEPCLVFDQIWWYLSMSSSLSQLLGYAVETCPGQINLVTFRSASHPVFFPLANSCKWPRVALSKTVQSWVSVHSVLPQTPFHTLLHLPGWTRSLTISWALHSSDRPRAVGLVSSACDSRTCRPRGHLSSQNCCRSL